MDTAVHRRRIPAHSFSYRVTRIVGREKSEGVAEADVFVGQWYHRNGRTDGVRRRLTDICIRTYYSSIKNEKLLYVYSPANRYYRRISSDCTPSNW